MKVSIVTVVWNALDSIEQTLKSIKNQDYDNIEYIVIDGKSTDGTIEIINKYNDIITTFKSEKDDGLYYAMNKGKNLATGDFILFMNAGDVFLKSSVISEMSLHMIKDTNKIYYGNTVIYFDDVQKLAAEIHHQSVFYPKSFYNVEDYNCQQYKVIAEQDYTHRALKKYTKEYCNINIILSRLEGYRILRYSKIKSAKSIYKEMMTFMDANEDDFTVFHRIRYIGSSVLKYCAFKIGGLPLAAKLALIRSRTVKTNSV